MARETARQAYTRVRNDVLLLVNALQQGLEEHKERRRETPRDWGYVGDLSHVSGELLDLVMFMLPSNNPAREEFDSGSEEKGREMLMEQLRNS